MWDRRRAELIEEFIPDQTATYESRPRRSLKQWLESHPLYDWCVAAYQNSQRSARKIPAFVRKNQIDMTEFEPVEYQSYADFFERRFRPGARTFPSDAREMGAFAEARYFGWERVEAEQRFPIKGHSLQPELILGDAHRARSFAGGPVILARLAPVDYHHVHHFDDGTTLKNDRLGHRLWTVNRHALQNKPDILFRNERHINILDTRNFGRVAFVEIGALSVGRIVQVHKLDVPFRRGDEKAVFRFGGSAIVAFGEAGAWCPSADILKNTEEGYETFVRLGQPIARGMA